MSQDSNWSEYTLNSSSSASESVVSLSGGYDYQFLTEPSKDLTCSVCLSVFRDPHLTSCCGNHFCEKCITSIKPKRCPLCQETNFTTMLNKNIDRAINGLKIYCPNKQKGCGWVGELKEVENHFGAICPYVQVTCSHCNQNIRRNKFSDHLTKCPKRPFVCEACGKIDAWQVITGSHRQKCPSWLVPCPNECSAKIMRKNVKKHLKICPLEMVACEYEFAGCLITNCRKDTTSHAQQEVAHHLSLLATAFKTEITKRDEEIASLKFIVELQEQQISELKSQTQVSSLPITLHMDSFQCYVSKARWFSNPFLSHANGYKLCLCVYPNGTGKGATSHLSVFLHIMLGENDDTLSWPFLGTVHVSLVAGKKVFDRKLEFTKRTQVAASRRVTSGNNMNKIGNGLPQFVELSELAACNVLQFFVERFTL